MIRNLFGLIHNICDETIIIRFYERSVIIMKGLDRLYETFAIIACIYLILY